MVYDDLLVEKEGEIATVTLNVPEKLNAINRKMGASIAQAAEDLGRDDDVRVVILTGAGRGFCSGADVSMMAGASGTQTRYASVQVMGWPFFDAFPRLNKPVIAAINGVCVGGGLSLALSCDIRLASDTARFGVMQVARALVPDYGLTFYLPHAIGMSNALRLMYTAEIIDASEGLRLGIVSQVVPTDALMKTARDLAGKIVQQAPLSVELSKKMVWRSVMDNLVRQVDLETYGQLITGRSEDHKASVRAFLEKKPVPRFQGK